MIICADDYGLAENINSAILNLVRLKKINAVSVLVRRADARACQNLLSAGSEIKIGLHLDFGNIQRQIDLFYSNFGFYPHYYDGHRHCHIYPLISRRLLKRIQQLPAPPLFVRSITLNNAMSAAPGLLNTLYVFLLSYLNSRFKKLLRQHGLFTNSLIFGAFNNHMPLEKVYELYKNENVTDKILFFHPGLETENGCKIPRRQEYEFIKQI